MSLEVISGFERYTFAVSGKKHTHCTQNNQAVGFGAINETTVKAARLYLHFFAAKTQVPPKTKKGTRAQGKQNAVTGFPLKTGENTISACIT